MIYLQKFLPVFFFPLTIVLFLLFLSVFLKKRKYIIVALSLLIFTSLPINHKILFRFVENQTLKLSPGDVQTADAIVVLGGFIGRVQSTDGPALEWGNASRFFSGLELLKAQKAPYIIFTNEKLPWMPQTASVGNFLLMHAIQMGFTRNQILITNDVQNTEEEAVAVGEIARDHNLQRIILVTSAFHMQRAVQLFQNQGFSVTPYPVNFGSNADQINFLDFIPTAQAMYGTEIAIKELIARTYYRFKIDILKNL